MLLNVTTSDLKYKVVMNEEGRLTAYRNGVEWRDCSGNNLIFMLAVDLQDVLSALADLYSTSEFYDFNPLSRDSHAKLLHNARETAGELIK